MDYIKSSGGIFRDMLIHDFDVFRWMLGGDGDEAAWLSASGSCLTDPAIGQAGDMDCTAVTIKTKKGRLCQINTTRRAAYGYDQRIELLGVGMLAGFLASVVAVIVGWALARFVFEFAWTASLWVPLAGSLAGALLALAAGWWGLRSVLRTPVVETLRKASA